MRNFIATELNTFICYWVGCCSFYNVCLIKLIKVQFLYKILLILKFSKYIRYCTIVWRYDEMRNRRNIYSILEFTNGFARVHYNYVTPLRLFLEKKKRLCLKKYTFSNLSNFVLIRSVVAKNE